MQDLSSLATDSMWPTSQGAGNRESSNAKAMTAHGSSPVDPDLSKDQQSDPQVKLAAPMKTGTDGKPQASGQASYTPGPARWVRTTVPQVVRSGRTGTTET